MAYGLRLTGHSQADGNELLQMEPTWWTISEVRNLVPRKWVKTDETGSYTDENLDISVELARQLHEHFKPAMLKEIAFNVSCLESCKNASDANAVVRGATYSEYVAQLREKLHTIETALGSDASKFAHFHLCIFEWDSGY